MTEQFSLNSLLEYFTEEIVEPLQMTEQLSEIIQFHRTNGRVNSVYIWIKRFKGYKVFIMTLGF